MDFIDLKAQQKHLGPSLNKAIEKVLQHGKYIMGPEVNELETALSRFCGANEVISCSSGTDALMLTLLAKDIRNGQAVFIPSFTFPATAEVVALLGGTPIFVDVLPDTFNMCSKSLEAAIKMAKDQNLKLGAIIVVDLFGQTADYESIKEIAQEHQLYLIADAAQSFGASFNGRNVGTLADCTTTSFFPAKPLGCYGDGGAVFTDDAELAEVMRSIRVHGQGEHKYENIRIGINGRLDTIQAAILLEKLNLFQDEIGMRQEVANRYNAGLAEHVITPTLHPKATSVWAQYTFKTPPNSTHRDAIAKSLKEKGIPTAIYYPKPQHLQIAYQYYPRTPTGMKVTEQLASEVLSLPMHPYLGTSDQNKIIEAVVEATQNLKRKLQ